jgi:hypothetical protein
MRRLRVILLALLVLVVPTFAFGGEEDPAGPATLSVSAELAGCGLAEANIVCQIDAGWNAIEGADYYTVSVTRADGSVIDLGQGAGTSRSIFVPYVGSGTYSVQVAAWGTPPGEEDPEVLVREQAMSTDDVGRGDDDAATSPGASIPTGDVRETLEPGDGPASEPEPAEEPVAEEPACAEVPAVEASTESTEQAVGQATAAETVPGEVPPAAEDPEPEPACP